VYLVRNAYLYWKRTGCTLADGNIASKQLFILCHHIRILSLTWQSRFAFEVLGKSFISLLGLVNP